MGESRQPFAKVPAMRLVGSRRDKVIDVIAGDLNINLGPHSPLTPIFDREKYGSAEGLRRGGYVLAETEGGDPELILIATGSEVALAVGAHEELTAEGIRSRVVSLPCWELFDRQDDGYKEEVLPPGVTARVSIEEASTLGWDRYVGPGGVKIGMHTFGTSAPLKDVQDKFGFSPDRVAEAAKELLS